MLEWLIALVISLLAVASIKIQRESMDNPSKDTVPIPGPLQTLFDVYDSNFTSYRATGIDAYKTAYQLTREQIDTMIGQLAKEVDERKEKIDGSLVEYEKASPKVAVLRKKANELHAMEPEVRDDEIRSEKAHLPKELDTTMLVAKSVAMFMLFAVGWLISYLL